MSPSPEDAFQIAHDAYIYGLPMVENYRVMYSNAVKAGLGYNRLTGTAALYTPANHEVPTPNNDTAYSKTWVDLRAEPMVLTVPPIPERRYYSFQIIDYFTNVIGYVGTRATGPRAGSYLFVGPGWTGSKRA
ncbi:DUF1254 domain-containing protein [Archangium lansingense]|uniref:DUF1254 domain-containing protein n=1 Tax=Archangium lansingense TaxID=2995310 RepID=A0ABT3ZXS4_9BACT|nr:DUF1254 domain-containing protein [Archangium lansinium]MCY1073819.1 DUF1254 domain-containing protein [Archangium lansinium]